MISCLMVTQSGRENQVTAAMECFARQTFEQKQLIVVHDGPVAFDQFLRNLADDRPDLDIRIFAVETGHTLGALRNIAVQAADHPLVCQWDDDDLYHPERLAVQYQAMQRDRSDFCFLTDQLHLFSDQAYLFWDDWSQETYPGNLIEGTLMGSKEHLGRYPEIPRGEDTELVHRLVTEGQKVTALGQHAWLYIYVYHGSNAWAADHHKAISWAKRLDGADLAERLDRLRQELVAYQLQMESVALPHSQGRYLINPETGARLD